MSDTHHQVGKIADMSSYHIHSLISLKLPLTQSNSLLVNISVMIKVMYVFVEIRFDPSHLVATIQRNFSTDQQLVLMGTIQFTGDVCMCLCV